MKHTVKCVLCWWQSVGRKSKCQYNSEALLDASEDDLEANTKESKFMSVPRHHITRNIHHMQAASNVVLLKHFVTTLNHCTHEKIKSTLNSGKAAIQFRIFHLPNTLFKSVRIKTYKTIPLPVVLYRCETWCLKLRGSTQTEGVLRTGA
jgi:hypothetical protein